MGFDKWANQGSSPGTLCVLRQVSLQASKVQSTRVKVAPEKPSLEKLQKALASPTKAVPFLSEAADRATDGLHKPIGLVLASAHILGSACLLSGGPGFTSPH